jgi:hypothetical protein
LWAKDKFEAQGYEAESYSRWTDKFDLLLNGILPVEVKRSRSYMRHVRPGYKVATWHFDVGRVPQDQDFLILLICEDEQGAHYPYLIPSWQIHGRHSVSITSHPERYKGYWAGSLNNWSATERLIELREQYNQSLPL